MLFQASAFLSQNCRLRLAQCWMRRQLDQPFLPHLHIHTSTVTAFLAAVLRLRGLKGELGDFTTLGHCALRRSLSHGRDGSLIFFCNRYVSRPPSVTRNVTNATYERSKTHKRLTQELVSCPFPSASLRASYWHKISWINCLFVLYFFFFFSERWQSLCSRFVCNLSKSNSRFAIKLLLGYFRPQISLSQLASLRSSV